MDRSADPRSAEAKAYRNLYATKRWKNTRQEVLVRDRYTCQMPGCGRLCGGKYPADDSPVVDHKTPHKGDEVLFWDKRNLWVLCRYPCHDQRKQAEEKRGFAVGVDVSGRPIDARHPWNRNH